MNIDRQNPIAEHAERAYRYLDPSDPDAREHNAAERLRFALSLKRSFDRHPWRRVGEHWSVTVHTDVVACALFSGHYSYSGKGFPDTVCGPGERIVLIREDALLVWHYTRYRKDGQSGVNCAIFRNVGAVRSSALLGEAMDLVWSSCPGVRLFTFINPAKVRSANPGYCFKAAGWRQSGVSKGGLLILEAEGVRPHV